MDKLKLAHEYFMKHVNTEQYKHLDDEDLISWSFDYVDAMQAEADKREDKARPNVLESVDPKEYMDAVLKNITESCDHEWTHIKYFGAEGDFYVCPCGAKSERPNGF